MTLQGFPAAAVGRWLVAYTECWEQLASAKLKHTYREVGDIAQGAYDWKIKNA